MKFTDKFFRFPVKMYLSKDIQERNHLNELLNKTEDPDDEIPYVLGWETVYIDDIMGYGTLFSRGMEIEDVERDGFDCTLVKLRSGDVGCAWTPEIFVDKLNEHADMLRKMEEEALQKRIEEQAVAIRIELEKTFEKEGLLSDKPKKKPWWKRLGLG